MNIFSSSKNQNLLLSFMLIFVFLLFSIALKNDFVYWDDPRYVFENELILNPNLTNLIKIFKSVVLLNYHPITMLSFWLNSFLFGMKPLSFILTNILFHLLNTYLIFRLVLKLKFEYKIAVIVSFFWAIHPMHVESVVWVSSRKDLLSTFFMLLALEQYLVYKYFNTKRLALIYVYFCLACLSKMNAICFPFLLFLIDYWIENRIDIKNIKSKMLFICISVAFFFLSFNLLGKGNAFGFLELRGSSQEVLMSKNTFFQHLTFASMNLGIYFFKLFIPIQLHHWYVYPVFQNVYYLFLIFPALLTIGLLKYQNKLLKFGVLFFLITIFLVLQIIQNSKSMLAERYTYLPYFGLILILIVNIEEKIKYKNFIYLLFGLFFSFMTFNHIKTWRNTNLLWENTFKFHPENREVAISLINLQNKNNDSDRAYNTCKNAIDAGLKDSHVFLTMAQIEIKTQEYQIALNHLSMAQFYNFKADSSIAQSINLNKSAVFGWLGKNDSSAFYLKQFQEKLKK